MRTARVFPRPTNATPTDPLAFVGGPPLFPVECDAVQVSVSFTWDLETAHRLADDWAAAGYNVAIGGPATGTPAADFEPGMFLAAGHVITSRGCPNHCWFCTVPEREGTTRELPIRDGWKVQDSNLLACSRRHVAAVFDMLARQPHRPEFLGGLEAARLERWHIDRLAELRPRELFLAYDLAEDAEAVAEAGQALRLAGIHRLSCYVLMGYPGDTPEAADARLREAASAGTLPRAMFYQPGPGRRSTPPEWAAMVRAWSRPAITRHLVAGWPIEKRPANAAGLEP